MRMSIALGAAALGLVGCGVAGCSTATAAEPLRDTTWQLMSIESMAPEESPSLSIDDPAKYTVTFGDDGRATFRIDCNHGNATYDSSASAPDSGSLSFGPIAVTRMACPRPSSDAAVSAALGRVRSYLLSDGLLHLSLEVDSGIMHWQPRPAG